MVKDIKSVSCVCDTVWCVESKSGEGNVSDKLKGEAHRSKVKVAMFRTFLKVTITYSLNIRSKIWKCFVTGHTYIGSSWGQMWLYSMTRYPEKNSRKRLAIWTCWRKYSRYAACKKCKQTPFDWFTFIIGRGDRVEIKKRPPTLKVPRHPYFDPTPSCDNKCQADRPPPVHLSA